MKIETPSHYSIFAIQPKEFIIANNLNFMEGNIVKYVSRSRFKNEQEKDLKKALSNLEDLIKYNKKFNWFKSIRRNINIVKIRNMQKYVYQSKNNKEILNYLEQQVIENMYFHDYLAAKEILYKMIIDC